MTLKDKIAKFDVVMPFDKWELWITTHVKETGTGNAGLFVEAKTEKEARKLFDNLIRVIKESEVEILK